MTSRPLAPGSEMSRRTRSHSSRLETAQRLFARVRFADQQVLECARQDAADTLADDRVIVDEQDALHAGNGPGAAGTAEGCAGGRGRVAITRYRAFRPT